MTLAQVFGLAGLLAGCLWSYLLRPFWATFRITDKTSYVR